MIEKDYQNGHYGEFKDEIEKENFLINELERTVKDLLKQNKKIQMKKLLFLII